MSLRLSAREISISWFRVWGLGIGFTMIFESPHPTELVPHPVTSCVAQEVTNGTVHRKRDADYNYRRCWSGSEWPEFMRISGDRFIAWEITVSLQLARRSMIWHTSKAPEAPFSRILQSRSGSALECAYSDSVMIANQLRAGGALDERLIRLVMASTSCLLVFPHVVVSNTDLHQMSYQKTVVLRCDGR